MDSPHLWKQLKGKIIADRYHLNDVLGSGTFGCVFSGTQKDMGRILREVAIKLISIPQNPEEEEQSFQELELVIHLNHPHFVHHYEVGRCKLQDGDFFYLVMELGKESLQQRLNKNSLLSKDELLELSQQIAQALNYIHNPDRDLQRYLTDRNFGKALVHRDLKPGNIIRVKDSWKLCDLGIARPINSTVSYTSHLAMTCVFAPPEAFQGTVSAASDIWALGITLAVASSGDYPFPAWKTDPQLMEYIQQYRLKIPNLPDRIATIVQKCLERKESNRWTAQQILEYLSSPPTPSGESTRTHASTLTTPTTRRWVLFTTMAVSSAGAIVLWEGLRGKTVKQLPNSLPNEAQPNGAPQVSLTPIETPSPTPTDPRVKTIAFETVYVNDRGEIARRENRQVEQLTIDMGNGLTLELIKIPSGRFTMGSPNTEAERDSNESPQHEVSVNEFWMGKYEVTQAQYENVMGTNPSYFKGAERPVEKVSWNDAKAFCQKLTQQLGNGVRLPSEAEWEYACRSGTTTPFHFGETITTQLVNFDGNYTYGNAPKGEDRNQTTNVGSFSPNTFGLYDMHGNVWEWCEDFWHDNYNGAPTDGSAWTLGGSQNTRILRGGSWFNNPWFCRSAHRNYFIPVSDYNYFGFRVVCIPTRTL